MRAKEFVFEEGQDLPTFNLISTLETLRDRTDQIRVDSLVNLVRKKPGSEMFNIDLLIAAYKDNQAVKNLITNIKDDDTGVKYVYLKGITTDQDSDINVGDSDIDAAVDNAQATVSSMARRAAKKRL